MTEQELNDLEQVIRDHKNKSQTSNVVMKLAQVERLIELARNGLKTAEVIAFDVAAQVRRNEQTDWRYQKRWSNHAAREKLVKAHFEKVELRNRKREHLLTKWKNFAGYQKSAAK